MEEVALRVLAGDGRRVVVRGDNQVVDPGLGEGGVEEGAGVSQAEAADEARIHDESISPAHRIAQLAASLDEEDCCRGHLSSTEERNKYHVSAAFLQHQRAV